MIPFTPLERLTEHVWMMPPSADKNLIQPAIGVICTPSQTVLYDSGNSPLHGQRILEALAAIDAPPVRYVIYSHHHWDHVFGGQVFADLHAEFIAHRTCQQRLMNSARHPWGLDYIKQVIRERPGVRVAYERLAALIPDWEHFRIILPTLVFDETMYTLHLDGVTLEIEHVGGGHSDDSTVLRVVEESVMFLSDSFYPGVQPQSDSAMMQRFLSEKQAVYVDGHNGRIWNRSD